MRLLTKKNIFIAVAILAIALSIYLVWPSDIKKIKRLFKNGVEGFEKKDIPKIMSCISYNYQDSYGGSYLQIREFLKIFLPKLEDIEIEYEIKEIKIQDETARVELSVRVLASEGDMRGYILGDAGKAVNLRFKLEKVGTKWLINNAEGYTE